MQTNKRFRALSPNNSSTSLSSQSEPSLSSEHTSKKHFPNTAATTLADKHSNSMITPTVNTKSMPAVETTTPTALSDKLSNVDVTAASSLEDDMRTLHGLMIEVEGNIGSGKSTLTNHIRDAVDLHDKDRASVFAETINNDFLGAFYQNIKRYSFSFQMYMLTTRLYQMQEGHRLARQEDKMVFLDRGAVGDTLFALLNYRNGMIDETDMTIYKSVCRDRLPATLSDKVDIVMYLDVDPTECHRRVTTMRQNKAEDGIPLAYLEGVDSCYFHLLMDWIGQRRGGFHEMNVGAAPPVCIIRWNEYGTTEGAVHQLARVRRGERKSPTVVFQVEEPVTATPMTNDDDDDVTVYPIVYRTVADIAAAYARLNGVAHTANPPDQANVTHAAFDWSLEHTNEFRRVAMYYLSVCGGVCFFGASTAVETEVGEFINGDLKKATDAAATDTTTTTTEESTEEKDPVAADQ